MGGILKPEQDRQDARDHLRRLRRSLEELAKMQEELRVIEAKAAQRNRAPTKAQPTGRRRSPRDAKC